MGMEDALLVLETSCVRCSASLWVGGELVEQVMWEAQRNRAALIFGELEKFMPKLRVAKLTHIIVGSGPGAYSGVRLALAVADGLALVHDAAVCALGSWNGLGITEPEAWVISDARRGGWAWGCLIDGILQAVPEVLSLEESVAKVTALQQKQVPIYSTESPESLEARGILGVTQLEPSAENLGKVWLSMTAEQRANLMSKPAEPMYIRAPHITKSKRPAWAVKP